ncbi:MAG: 3-oxoacyl-[acyl-carrier-protein] synthase III C-terminal domain-containing protein, partial [Clostridium butyricum]
YEVLNRNILKRGDIILFVAFGAGLSLGAVLIEW